MAWEQMAWEQMAWEQMAWEQKVVEQKSLLLQKIIRTSFRFVIANGIRTIFDIWQNYNRSLE